MTKRVKNVAAALIVIATLSGCSLTYERHSSNSDYVLVKGSEINVSMTLHGDMRVNPEETEIVYLAPGSKINVSSRGSVDKRKVKLRGLAGGEIETEYEVNGKSAEFDDEAQAWFASVVPILSGQSGVDIPERVERLYRVGGENLVIDRIAIINSDYSQGRHLSYLFEHKLLSDKGIERSIDLLSNIQSDFELSKVIKSLAKSQSLSEKNWVNLLEQSKSIQSDFEMGKLFIAFRNIDLPINVLSELSYVSAGYIQSDAEQAKVLKALAKNKQYNERQWLDLLDSSKAIQSDSELSRVLNQVLDNDLNEVVLLALVDLARSHISSSSNQADVLTKLIKRNEVTPTLKRALIRAVDDIGSSYEQNKLLKLLLA